MALGRGDSESVTLGDGQVQEEVPDVVFEVFFAVEALPSRAVGVAVTEDLVESTFEVFEDVVEDGHSLVLSR